jgi:S1-C subfamily serine protease
MNTAISSTTGFNQGYGFAVPIELVGEVVDDLIQYGEVRRAILGVSVTSVTAEDAEFYGLDEVAGVVVQDFGALGSAQSAARDAGLERGDVIVSLEGAQISTVSELQTRLRAFSPGETVTIGLIRRSTKEHHEIRVELQQRPAETRVASAESPPDAADHLGISVRDLEEARSAGLELDEDVSGVIISDVSRTGALGRSNIQPGLIIQDINGQAVNTVDEYHEIVQALQPGGIANLALLDPRSGSRLTLSVRLPS